MKRNEYGLCSIQECNQLRASIFDAVEEWINYCASDPIIGIAIEQESLNVALCEKEEAQSCEWFSFETLITNGEVNADAVLDLADKFCMVR